MGSRKKTNDAPFSPPRMRRLAAYLAGPGRPLTFALLLIAGFGLGTWGVLIYVWPRRLARDYIVARDNVAITPQPGWIHSDVRAEVFRGASLDGPLSILDDNLPERISDAFSLHPWVAKVVSVSRKPMARMAVELVYRRPVCMVEVPGEPLPVDVEGRLLPSGDFSPVEKSSYLRLTGIDTVPMGPPGQPWGDGRVVGGAEIAAALGDGWRELKLDRITPVPRLPTAAADEPTYQLFTRGGTRILWGLAPGSKGPEELPPAEKVARLRRYAADHETLEGNGGPQTLDIRLLPPGKGR